jgi:hypothetical protein
MLVSNQIKTDGGSRVMRDLISSCYEAQERFRSAAANSGDDTLKRLFEIYAQQRTRFAQELRQHLPSDSDESEIPDNGFESEAGDDNSLRNCLDSDLRTLQLYRQALASRDLPTRTHFLISSQLALLERAHDRVSSLMHKSDATARSMVVINGRARA